MTCRLNCYRLSSWRLTPCEEAREEGGMPTDKFGNKACCLTCSRAVNDARDTLCSLLQEAMDIEDAPSVSLWFVCDEWRDRHVRERRCARCQELINELPGNRHYCDSCKGLMEMMGSPVL